MGTLGTTLVIQGSRGTPNGHIGVQESIFIDFRVQLGRLLGDILETFLRFFYDLGAKVGDSFQVHGFDDPEVEMLLESSGCMCYKHNKNNGFSDISRFPLIHEFSVSREGFRHHFGDFW